MKLTREGIKEREAWEKAGIDLPGYDVEAVTEKAKEEPGWVHFGIGNIFRVFIGGIADGLLEEGVLDRGITCVETFDYDVVDKIYAPYDNLGLNVILHGDGTREYKVLGALAEAVKAQSSDAVQWNRLKEIFTAKSLQLVSFTITEKGYALQKADGTWFPFVEADIKNGPDKATGAMAVLVAMLNERYKAGKYPIALVSMDNCSQNGAKLRESVLTMTEEWHKAGFVDDGFVDYVTDEKVVAFPWTMIDKITPRPSEQIAADLEKLGVEAGSAYTFDQVLVVGGEETKVGDPVVAGATVEATKSWVLNWDKVASASWFAVPKIMPVKWVFDARAIVPICIMFIVTAVETVGDISGITEGGLGREATDKELSGGVMCDGLGSSLAAVFGVLPNTSFSQNVGLVAMNKVVNRFSIATGGIFLIACGLFPKLAALISIMPQSVLGGAAVMMFSSIVVSGIQLITKWPVTPRNVTIVSVALGLGYGLGANSAVLAHMPQAITLIFGGSGIVPAALFAIILNIVLPPDEKSEVEIAEEILDMKKKETQKK